MARDCPHCGSSQVSPRETCPRCGLPPLGEELQDRLRDASEQLVRELRASPYFRTAGVLGYTLRGQLRGFLEDPGHPLATTLLRYLHRVAVEGGSERLKALLQTAVRLWILPATPLLAAALVALRRRYRSDLERAATGDDAVGLRRLRGRAARGEIEAERCERFLQDAFERWHAELRRRRAGSTGCSPGS